MPSPLPGMDPYIEHPEVWSDFHGDLAAEVRAVLNQEIQPRYVARLVPRVTYEIVEVEEIHGARPDVGVWRPEPASEEGYGGVAVIAAAPAESLIAMEVPLRLFTVEVREVGTLRLVTAIEILSPSNKQPGHDACEEYLRKRRSLLRSEAHLIEIDFLRGGQRPPLDRPVPPAPYYVTLSRSNRRPRVEVWPIQLRDKLPVIPVPLLYPDPDAPLDLGRVVAAVYERGAYARLIDYRQPPPPPPLSDADAAWLDERLVAEKAR
ncbi:MAG: DUF4058 family protein [Planctomycetes bacterium]|nr:DUF4058 family protein [Planctomycetota bacterium]